MVQGGRKIGVDFHRRFLLRSLLLPSVLNGRHNAALQGSKCLPSAHRFSLFALVATPLNLLVSAATCSFPSSQVDDAL